MKRQSNRIDKHYNMDKSQNNYVSKRNQTKEENIWNDYIYKTFWKT